VFIFEKYFTNLLKSHWAKKAEIYMKAFTHSTKSSLLNHGLQVLGGATIRETVFTYDYIVKIFLKHSKEPLAKKTQIYMKVF
jgi:hypothetical protein